MTLIVERVPPLPLSSFFLSTAEHFPCPTGVIRLSGDTEICPMGVSRPAQADVVRTDRHRLRPLERDTAATTALRSTVRARRDLVIHLETVSLERHTPSFVRCDEGSNFAPSRLHRTNNYPTGLGLHCPYRAKSVPNKSRIHSSGPPGLARSRRVAHEARCVLRIDDRHRISIVVGGHETHFCVKRTLKEFVPSATTSSHSSPSMSYAFD